MSFFFNAVCYVYQCLMYLLQRAMSITASLPDWMVHTCFRNSVPFFENMCCWLFQAHDVSVRAMRWSHNNLWMVTADHAGYVKYWQSNMNNVKMYQGHKEPIRGVRLESSSASTPLPLHSKVVSLKAGDLEHFHAFPCCFLCWCKVDLLRFVLCTDLLWVPTGETNFQESTRKFGFRCSVLLQLVLISLELIFTQLLEAHLSCLIGFVLGYELNAVVNKEGGESTCDE